MTCTACRTRSPAGARFCSVCGSALRPVGQAPTELRDGDHGVVDRRQLTVLFSDLVGSVAMSTQLDPEDLRQVMSDYQRCCAEVIEQHHGFIARYMGDGILAYFGYPTADEADADRAVRAGLALVREVNRRGTDDLPLRARVGIATGQVVVGDLVGRGAALERGVIGVTPNLAARLQAAAEPNTVVIGAATKRLVGGLFAYRDLGRLTLRGFDQPVPAWEVLHETSVGSRLEARVEGAFTPLVGRQAELALLLSQWELARSGEGRTVLIAGEPGIGKSRITEELEQQLAGEPHVRLRWFCSPHHTDTALYPSIAHMTRAAGLAREDTPDDQLRKLETMLAPLSRNPREEVPLIADLLSIPTGDRYPPLALTPQKRKERTFAALLDYLTGLAAREPILAVVEDVHWLDPTSRELLDLCVQLAQTHRILLLITCRPEFEPPWLDWPCVTALSLDRLNAVEGAELCASVTGKSVPPEILRQIVDKSDGIPLFVEELTKTVLESGLLEDLGDRFVVSGAAPSLAVPSTLHDSLVARLDRLGSMREVAHIGAAIGRVFGHDLLAAVSHASESQLQAALRELVRSELITQRDSGANATYTFKHALVRDAAYASLLKEPRRGLHARIAAAIEARFPARAEKEPEEVGRHYTEAGAPAQAIPYWRRAGARAASRAAHLEATDHFRRAINLLSSLPEDLHRYQIELDLQTQLGLSLSASRGYASAEVQTAYDRARTLCEILDNPTELFAVLRGLWSYYYTRNDMVTARALGEDCIRIGETANAPSVLIEGYTAHGYTLVAIGELSRARECLLRALEMYDAHDGSTLEYTTPQDPAVACLSMLSVLAWTMGDAEAGATYNELALRTATSLGHPFGLAYAYCYAASFEFHRGRPEVAIQHAMASIGIAQEHGFDIWIISSTFQMALAKGALGETAEAIGIFKSMLHVWQSIGAEINRSFFLAGLARAYRDAGMLTEALQTIEAGVVHAEHHQERGLLPLVYLLRGEIRAVAGDGAPDDATADMVRALELARQHGSKMYEIHALLSLRNWERTDGRYDEDIEPLRHLIPYVEAQVPVFSMPLAGGQDFDIAV